jgi:hypothetical protein
VLVTYLAILATLLPAQSSELPSAHKDDLYARALEASIVQMDKQWGHINDSFGGRIRTDYHHLKVEKDPQITDELPLEFGDRSVEYLDEHSLIERWKKLGKSFSVLKIRPIRNHIDLLKINITVYWVSYEKERLVFALSDWSDVEFRHDCEQKKFVITSVKLGGI